MASKVDEEREGVRLTNLDASLFDGAVADKRALVDYLDGVSHLLLPELRQRPLSVIRVHRGQDAFMQKNLPAYAPEWIERVPLWAETSKRTVDYALCNDRRTLLWFANQRAVEYHPALLTVDDPDAPTHLVLDLDPPAGDTFGAAAEVALLVREALAGAGLDGVVKTSGAKGVHVFVPVRGLSVADAAAATRAIAARTAAFAPDLATTEFLKDERGGKVFVDATRVGGATVVAAYSPRVRPGTPVSFPVSWDELPEVRPAEITITNALGMLDRAGPWLDTVEPQAVPAELVVEGHAIEPGRVQAMHEGKRRKRAAGS